MVKKTNHGIYKKGCWHCLNSSCDVMIFRRFVNIKIGISSSFLSEKIFFKFELKNFDQS